MSKHLKMKSTFERKEKKYLLTRSQYKELRQRLIGYMTPDEYGKHTIMSLYYDTEDYELIKHSIEKPEYKEKFRIRSYGVPSRNDNVFLEIKKKCCGIGGKRRISMPLKEVNQFFKDNSTSVDNSQILDEIKWFNKRYKIEPKVLICYDRIAMFDQEDEDFRITFDFDIRYRDIELDMTKGDWGNPVAPEIYCLMEVKVLGSYPVWFSNILSDMGVFKDSFSKYAQCYVRYLSHSEEIKHVI